MRPKRAVAQRYSCGVASRFLELLGGADHFAPGAPPNPDLAGRSLVAVGTAPPPRCELLALKGERARAPQGTRE